MSSYMYQALDKGGRTVKGVIEASGEEVIVDKLRGMGYFPLSVTRKRQKMGELDLLALPGLRFFFHRIKTKHITTFTRQLATLIEAGLPITRSLYVLQEQVESSIFKKKIGEMARAIEQGSNLSDAMARHPRVFDNLYVNMVRAGELGGVLETVLDRLADFMEKRHAVISKVRAAMMYPVTVMTLAIVIVSVILVFIIPRFEAIFADLGVKLPWMTQQLVMVSDILSNYFPFVAMGIVALIVIYVKLNQVREAKYVFDYIKLHLPVFGELLRKSAIVRFAGTLATLIRAGVPILQAIDIVRDTSGNEVVSRAMEQVYQSVKNGETIHEPLRQSGIFPPLVIHMMAVGEETGAIDRMLNKVAEAYEREVEDMVDALTSILEPLLMVILGAIIGVVVIALYLPLFTIGGGIPQS